MRSKNKELMQQILDYIESYFFEHHHSPSTTEIGTATGLSRSGAYKYLVAMSERGMIQYENGVIHTERMKKYSFSGNTAPVIGNIVCGTPDIQEENIEEYVTLPQSLFGKGDFFVLRAYGESMINAGINADDLVVVNKQLQAKDGDIVVALVDGSTTLKRLYRDDEKRKVILHPENDTMEDMVFDSVAIQGVAVHVIKALK